MGGTVNVGAGLGVEGAGAEEFGGAELGKMLDAEGAACDRLRRDGQWWVSALGLLGQYGDQDERTALAGTRCLPIRGGGRVRPSPTVDEVHPRA